MARQASGRIAIQFKMEEVETPLGADGQRSRLEHLLELAIELANGTSDSQIDRVYSDTINLTTTPTDLDLVGSTVLSKLNGQAISLVDLVAIVVLNTATSGNVIVGGDANAVAIFGAAAHTAIVLPGGGWVWYGGPAGLVLTGGTADILQLAASAGTVGCKVGIAGRSA